MTIPLLIPVSPAAMLAAVACVVAGGPWFADGLRALRVRRWLASLPAEPAEGLHEGAVVTRGTVGLESPLFAPLSARPCAGYTLDVRTTDEALGGRLREARPFRIVTRDGAAHVDAAAARWDLQITAERTVGSRAELSENLVALLESDPELRWLVARGVPLVLSEHALVAGSEACVLGVARQERAAHSAVAGEVALQRTGTDGDAWPVAAVPAAPEAAAWHIGAAEPLGHCVVSDRAPVFARLAPAAWRASGVLFGPALSLAGLLVLAHALGAALERSV